MDELIKKIDKLERSLNSLEIIKKIDDSFNKIISNKKLIADLKKYHESPDEKLKLSIYNYSEFIEYKKYENDINLLIIEINTYLKKINDSRSCI